MYNMAGHIDANEDARRYKERMAKETQLGSAPLVARDIRQEEAKALLRISQKIYRQDGKMTSGDWSDFVEAINNATA